MIYLSFTLSNPFSNRFSVVYEKTGKTWHPHKFWDLTICKNSAIIGFSIDYTIRQDHAGFGFEFDLLGWNVEYRFYDSRHWDYENNCFESSHLAQELETLQEPSQDPSHSGS